MSIIGKLDRRIQRSDEAALFNARIITETRATIARSLKLLRETTPEGCVGKKYARPFRSHDRKKAAG